MGLQRTRDWVAQFLGSRGLEKPDGSPIYAYRCNDSEFGELGVLIRSETRLPIVADRLSVSDCGLFCLYSAEWWRRNHESGPWKWEGILESMGWSGTPIGKLYPIVREGLHFWPRRREFGGSHTQSLNVPDSLAEREEFEPSVPIPVR
jgi:hypothetical protein